MLRAVELDTPPEDFLPDEPEGSSFHKAFQASDIAGFDCRYLAIFRENQRIAVVPFFLGRYSFGTLLPNGLLKRMLSWIKIDYVCAGHPSTDFGLIDGEISEEIVELAVDVLSKKARLVAWKGFSENLPVKGFIRARGLPVAVLTTTGDYYSQLNGHRRNDFRHKLKIASSLRFEEHSALPDHLLQAVYQLYLDTLKHAEVSFERLTPGYFSAMSGVGKFQLYFEGDRLVGFLQMISKGEKTCLKYMGMDHLCNRQYYLYFAMCLRGIESAAAAGCKKIELGVSSYQAKRLMGCDLIETCVYYRHSNPLIHRMLEKLKFLLEPKMAQLR